MGSKQLAMKDIREEENVQSMGGTESESSPSQPSMSVSAAASNVPRRGSNETRASPGQEREALLARATLSRPHRMRSGSYGSRGDLKPDSDSERGSPQEQLLKRDIQQHGLKEGRNGDGLSGKGETSRKKTAEEEEESRAAKDGSTLVMAFIVMIVVGTGNRVFMKLQTYPMYNYPFFLTMLSTFVYVPVCFMYIVPMLMFGSSITPEQQAIPKFKFAVMGLLDSIAGIMGVFAVNYIDNAAVIVLLQQAAIPISMSISRMFLGAKYTSSQYVGATVVIAGIIVTLIPTFFGAPSDTEKAGTDAGTQIMWSIVQVLSCIPMCLSSVYKEKALGDDDMDVVYLNGWVAVFQFMASLLFAVPSAYAMGLPVEDLPMNSYQGYLCFLGRDSQFPNMAAGMQHQSLPPDHCGMAPFFVSMYLCFNLAYNVVLIVILKYGSANVLFLASTVMVPIGNVAFSLKFVPRHQDLRPSDTMGLFCILAGLVIYRFSKPVLDWLRGVSVKEGVVADEAEKRASRKMPNYVGINQLEYLEPLMQTRLWKANKGRLLRSPEQIRASFMHRLGLPPSPLVPATSTTSSPRFHKGSGSSYVPRRGTLPNIARHSPISNTSINNNNPRASPGSNSRASPLSGYRMSPAALGYRASPSARASPGSGAYRSIPPLGSAQSGGGGGSGLPRSPTPGSADMGKVRKIFGARRGSEAEEQA